MKNCFFVADCVEFMKDMDANSVDLTLTSPPYDDLRSYNGYTFDFEVIADGLYRVTKEGGVVVWIVGDSIKNGNRSLTSFRQGIFFQDMGFNVHDVMVFEKKNTFYSGNGRYTNCYDFMLILSKGKPKTFTPLQLPKKWSDKRFPTDRITKHRTNIWTYEVGCGQKTKDKIAYEHPAIFPERLALDHIQSWSKTGDLVFDPMCGSGTVGKMALSHGRYFIGCDISPEYIEIAKQRIGLLQYL